MLPVMWNLLACLEQVNKSIRIPALDRLPDRVLAEIFIQTHLSHKPRSERRHPLYLGSQPAILCRVSKRWKRVAESTPAIWQNFTYFPLTRPLDPHLRFLPCALIERACARMQRWIELASTDSPQGLEFSFAAHFNHSTLLDDAILGVLTEHSNHWQSVDISIPTNDDGAMYHLESLRNIRGNLAKLETLTVEWPDTDCKAVVPTYLAEAFQEAPRLREVVLNGFWQAEDAENSAVSVQLPWHQLDSVDFEGRGFRKTYYLLALLSSVSFIRIRPTAPSEEEAALLHAPIITLPAVKTLEFINSDFIYAGKEAGRIFSYLRLPNLESFTLLERIAPRSYQAAREMLVQSKPSRLKSVILTGASRHSPEDVLGLLHAAGESLEYLDIDGQLDGPGLSYSRARGRAERAVEDSFEVLVQLAAIIRHDHPKIRMPKLKKVVLRVEIGFNLPQENSVLVSYAQDILEAAVGRSDGGEDGDLKIDLLLDGYVSSSEKRELQEIWEEFSSNAGNLWLPESDRERASSRSTWKD